MESIEELIKRINRNTAAQIEQSARMERWAAEMGLAPLKRQEREPTELELLLQKWEQTSVAPQSPEPEGEEPPLPEPRGEGSRFRSPEGRSYRCRSPEGRSCRCQSPGGRSCRCRAQRGGAAAARAQRGGAAAARTQRGGATASGAQGGGEKHTSTTAPTTTPTVQFGTAASSPSPLAPGHPAGLSGPPFPGPRAQECATLATALSLVPCSTPTEHPDVAGLLPDVAVAPPVRCFASRG
ncbi:UNVERIFIED_CONTAM: hypothetical protein FKN15_030638 [Acipenser sinensis]